MTSSELPSSKLGTKQYWDRVYFEEYNNFTDHGDRGEVWFGANVSRRIVKWLADCSDIDKENVRVLDIGCGNGDLLFHLKKAGFHNLTGVDYAESAVKLATAILESSASTVGEDGRISFQVGNILKLDSDDDGSSKCASLQQKYDVCLDKGTYDAISLNPDDAGTKRLVYLRNVGCLLTRNGLLLLTSCNWTADELVHHFQQDFELVDEIEMPKFRFGGQEGQTVTSLVLRKKKPT